MAGTVRDVMTSEPTTVQANATLADAARIMRDSDVGAVVVLEGSRLAGMVTDRDVVTRAIAESRDPASTTVADICTEDLVTLTPDDTIEQAAELMRERAVRRLPVVEGERPVGIVSLADLSERDPEEMPATFADVTSAPPNN